MHRIKYFFSIFILFPLFSFCSEAPGTLDPSFDGDGRVVTNIGGLDNAFDILQQTDGKLIAIGRSSGDFALVRYQLNGSVDTSFGTNGIVIYSLTAGTDIAFAGVLRPDGRILTAGVANQGATSDFGLAQFQTNGMIDVSFNGTGQQITDFGVGADLAQGLVLQPNGFAIAAGAATIAGPALAFGLARYDTIGGLDILFGMAGLVRTSFPGFTDARASDVILQPDGKIIAGGVASNIGQTSFALARYNNDGSLDISFGTGGLVTTSFADLGAPIAVIEALVLQPDGKIVAGGTVNTGSNSFFALVRYNSDGSLDTTFGSGDGRVITAFTGFTSTTLTDIILQLDGKIVATGFAALSGTTHFALVRYNSDGSIDTTFGTDGNGRVTTAFIEGSAASFASIEQFDGKLVLAGAVAGPGGGDFALARYFDEAITELLQLIRAKYC